MTVLRVEGLGKHYDLSRGHGRLFLSAIGLASREDAEGWVLKNVSFTLGPGEALGIVGQNGAGKSTLLKLLSGVTAPSAGTISLTGRKAAILELGTGFNVEFTGAENARHVLSLMGHSNTDLPSLMAAVEDFAELGDFFHRPTRTYSSGMAVRLAFSVATASRPELLIVDEALSVGDAYFQHKSFDRLRAFKAAGTSLIVVSHGMGDIRSLCDTVIVLDAGQVVKSGSPETVIDYYNALIAAKDKARMRLEQGIGAQGWQETRSGTGEAVVEQIDIFAGGLMDSPVSLVKTGQDMVIRTRVRATSDIPQLVLGLMLRDRAGHVVWGSNTFHSDDIIRDVKAGETIDFVTRLPANLGQGSYSISPALVSTDTHLVDNFDWIDNYKVFEVINADFPVFIGSSHLPAAFSVTRNPLKDSAL